MKSELNARPRNGDFYRCGPVPPALHVPGLATFTGREAQEDA